MSTMGDTDHKHLRSTANPDFNFEQALDYLDAFINFERKMPGVYQADSVDPTRGHRLLQLLGSPHEQLVTIHVAGSKGKGSVSAMCAACLRAAGLRVGLYTSPHLRHIRERMRVISPADPLGEITPQRFAGLVSQVATAVEQVPGITWFEILTAMALLHFAQEEVDLAVIEVGLGGRLDATNIIMPLVSVITRISYEHTSLLGDTLTEIAREKAGIIKPGVPVVVAPQAPEVLAEISRVAASQQAPLLRVGLDTMYEARPGQLPFYDLVLNPSSAFPAPTDARSFTLGLAGRHQVENAAVAHATLQQLGHCFQQIDAEAIRKGLAEVNWPGRMQMLRQPGPHRVGVLIDGAHTPDSAAWLAVALRESIRYNNLRLLISITRGKDVPHILGKLLPLAAETVVTQATHPRSMAPQDLLAEASLLGYSASTAPNVIAGMKRILSHAKDGDLICVTGSLFLVGDLLNQWERLKSLLDEREA